MTISTKSLRTSLYAGFGTAFITVIGMLTAFSERYIITGVLTLSIAILAAIYLGIGMVAARQAGRENKLTQAVNGALGSLIILAVTLAVTLAFQQVNALVDTLGSTIVFPNITDELFHVLTFGRETASAGYLLHAVIAVVLGALGGLALNVPAQLIGLVRSVVIAIVVLGLLQDQMKSMIALPDALWLAVAVLGGFLITRVRNQARLLTRVLEAAAGGVLLGLLLGVILLISGATSESLPGFLGNPTILASVVLGRGAGVMLLTLAVLSAVLGAIGGTLSSAPGTVHSLGISVLAAGLMLGVLNLEGSMTLLTAILVAIIMIGTQLLLQRTTPEADTRFGSFNLTERRTSQIMTAIAGLLFALVLPNFLSGYFTNVLDLIALYIMMGLGLNIVVGFAGLLDLGYVAFFAIGAYAVGVLTTPNALTCGPEFAQLAADQIQSSCTLLTFWTAWPIAVLTSGLAGVALGIPVLRLRGDYLAIVTLGFGEIIRLVALSDLGKPYFGGAQGIVGIPSPIINLTSIAEPLATSGIPLLSQLGSALSEPIALSQPNQIYYLILFGVLVTAFISNRLSASRLGRAWRAMKEDEDVAQAMGINLVQTKLLAFSIGAAFSGLGGAIFGSYIKSIFPNSFTLLVSINVLSLIIIGGLGSIPGVFVGALVIFGLPEALREFEEFRLLMFGALLVLTMLLRPEGLLPPTSARLEEKAEKALAEEGA
ncbi:MAG: hypothetical protein Kow0077_16600 [Anaerolineae bacterium]